MVWSIGIKSYGFRRKVSEDEFMQPGQMYEFEVQTQGEVPKGQEHAFLVYVKGELEKKYPYLRFTYLEYGSHVLVQSYLPQSEVQAQTIPPQLIPLLKYLLEALIFALIAWGIYQIASAVYMLASAFGPEGAAAIGSIIGLVVIMMFMSWIMNFFRGITEAIKPPKIEAEKPKEKEKE